MNRQRMEEIDTGILIHFSPKIRVTEAIGVNDILYLFSELIN